MKERKYNNYIKAEISYTKFPKEKALVIYIDNSGNNILNESAVNKLISDNKDITCVGFIGDTNKQEIVNIAKYIKQNYENLNTGWYSEETVFPLFHGVFNYIKLGYDDKDLTDINTKQTFYINTQPEKKDYLNASFMDVTEQLFRRPDPLSPDYFDYMEELNYKNLKD